MRQRPRAKQARDLDLAAVDQRERGEQRAQDERRVDRHLGQDDAPGRIEKVDRRMVKTQARAERAVQDARRAVEEGEGERHQEGRQGDEGVDHPRDKARAGNGAKARIKPSVRPRTTHPTVEASGDLGGIEQGVEERAGVQDLERRSEIAAPPESSTSAACAISASG